MTGTHPYIEHVEIDYRDNCGSIITAHIDILDNTLSHRWLEALIDVIRSGLHLEKNYCFLGWSDAPRNGQLICSEINRAIQAINSSHIDYHIDDYFDFNALINHDLDIDHGRLNQLHRYFEDLQGVSGSMSVHYEKADAVTRWYIRQLNLLCHEFETWALSWLKKHQAPEWQRPCQLMSWLRAPRFELTAQDHELFGIDSLYRDFGGVYLGVNKAIGKHHWEVFKDEGSDSRIGELTTTTLNSQTEAAADFDIEWARNTRGHPWMATNVAQFRQWLINNGFDPEDPELTIGHPKVAQIDFERFPVKDPDTVWRLMYQYLDVYRIRVAGVECVYDYRWSDDNYQQLQIQALGG